MPDPSPGTRKLSEEDGATNSSCGSGAAVSAARGDAGGNLGDDLMHGTQKLLTGLAHGGTGDVWVADGYGQSLVHRYGADGTLRGAGFDENHDGRVDVFKKYGPDGKVIEETRDTDHDGVLAQRSTDTDGDGKFDKVVPYQSK